MVKDKRVAGVPHSPGACAKPHDREIVSRDPVSAGGQIATNACGDFGTPRLGRGRRIDAGKADVDLSHDISVAVDIDWPPYANAGARDPSIPVEPCAAVKTELEVMHGVHVGHERAGCVSGDFGVPIDVFSGDKRGGAGPAYGTVVGCPVSVSFPVADPRNGPPSFAGAWPRSMAVVVED